MNTNKSIKPWHKLLWVHQPYPDNYVDASFLSQLKRNQNVTRYSYWALVGHASTIVAHICTVVIFGSIFVLIYDRGIKSSYIAFTSTFITLIGYIIWVLGHNNDNVMVIVTLKSSSRILSILLGLSPVIKSLSQSMSSDSIWTISLWLLLCNILFHDYSGVKRKLPTLSTNLAMSSAVVLASRLSSTLSVFCFLLLSIQLFGLFPIFTTWIINYWNNKIYCLMYFTLFFLASQFAFFIGHLWALSIWFILWFSIQLGAPGLLIGLQQYKNEIQGPWDPARPVLKTNFE